MDNIKNQALLQEFPGFSNLTTSKTKKLYEISSIFKVCWRHQKTTQFCETSFKNRKLPAELTASYQCVLRFSRFICLKYCPCHEKVRPVHTKCCTCYAKSSQQTWRSDAPKCNPSQEISAHTSKQVWLMCLLYCACPPHACQRFWICYKTLTFCTLFSALRLPPKTTSQLPKVLQTWQLFTVLTSKCASCHNAVHFFNSATSESAPRMVCLYHFDFQMCSCHNDVHFFDISTSKSAPNLTVFHSFDFEMCFLPQWRALFQQRNFRKCSKNGVPVPLWLPNAFPATTMSTFSTSQLPKLLRTWQFFLAQFWLRNVLRATMACNCLSLMWPDGSAPAALASLLFDLPEPRNIGKTQRSFFWLFLFSDLLSSAVLFPGSSHLYFFICPCCRKFHV